MSSSERRYSILALFAARILFVYSSSLNAALTMHSVCVATGIELKYYQNYSVSNDETCGFGTNLSTNPKLIIRVKCQRKDLATDSHESVRYVIGERPLCFLSLSDLEPCLGSNDWKTLKTVKS